MFRRCAWVQDEFYRSEWDVEGNSSGDEQIPKKRALEGGGVYEEEKRTNGTCAP